MMMRDLCSSAHLSVVYSHLLSHPNSSWLCLNQFSCSVSHSGQYWTVPLTYLIRCILSLSATAQSKGLSDSFTPISATIFLVQLVLLFLTENACQIERTKEKWHINTFKCQELLLLWKWEYYQYRFFVILGDWDLLHLLIKWVNNDWMLLRR